MSNELVLQMATFKVLYDHAKTKYDTVRAEMSARMARGDRLNAVTSSGIKIAAVSKKDPKPIAEITDPPAFRTWVAQHYPDRMVNDLKIIGSDEEIKDVLLEHAPHLLREISKPDPDLERVILAESKKYGAPAGPNGEVEIPGVDVTIPEGVVACVPTEQARAAVVEMLQRGDIDLFDVLPVGGGE